MRSSIANAIAALAFAVLVPCATRAAQPALEPGTWKLHIVSTVNGKPEPVQDTQECLIDELKDLGAYFAPVMEGVQAKCRKTRVPSADPRKLVYRTQCSGTGFSTDVAATVTIESPRSFLLNMRMNTKTRTESALVVATANGRWSGPCTK